MARKNWTEEQKTEIIDSYIKKGLSMQKIAKLFDCDPRTISRLLKQNNIPNITNTVNRRLKEDFFENIDSEEKAYFLGLLITDGTVSPSNPLIRLALTETDVQILKDFQKVIQHDGKLSFSKGNGKTKPHYVINICSKQMKEDLSKYGVIPQKTELMTSLYKEVEESLLPHYLRGLIDGDGYIYKGHSSWYVGFTTKYYQVADDVLSLLYTFFPTEKRNKIYKNGKGGRNYQIMIGGKKAGKICEALYLNSHFHIPRKYELAMEVLKKYQS